MVQWDKDSCADAGFLKLDLLGLGMLSAVERCVVEIERTRNERIDLSRIDFDDREVYEAIQAAETTGVFQIESRAQMSMLPRTLPENLDDLTVQVALVRPGPIQGGAVHPYIAHKKALREDPSFQVPYEHPSLEPVLKDTLGVIVFQDQVIEVAMAFAGFTAGDAEGLRRAMSRKRSEAAMRAYERQFVEGAVERGADAATAQRVYDQIVGFSGFGFPKSHSAAFGLLAYQSTWLRVHYGPEFLCALMNEQPMGFYPSDALVHEAQRRGIEVLPPCVQTSGHQTSDVRRVEGSDGAGVRERCAGGRGPGLGGGARSGAVALGRGSRLAVGLFRRHARQAGLGRSMRWVGGWAGGGAAAQGAVAARRGGAGGAGGGGGEGGHAARAAARSARRPGAARARPVGPPAGRLRLDRRHPARAPDGADAPRPARARHHQRRLRQRSATAHRSRSPAW